MFGRRRHVLMALEPRMLLDAAGAESFVDDAPAEVVPPGPAATETARREVLFIDTNLAGYADLAARAAPHVEVVLLDGSRDGVQGIADYLLQTTSPVDAVHLFSHGRDGQITLGSTEITATTLPGLASSLRDWGAGLSNGADILIYGCDVAGGPGGEALVQQLSLLTGADVAASDDPTGPLTAAADWDLEYATGAIEGSLPGDFSAHLFVLSTYQRLFFRADNGVSGTELWFSDGTSEGTMMLMDVNPGAASSWPGNFVEMGNKLYFTADDGVNGTELWVSDGSVAGTRMVKDIAPGATGSSPYGLVVVGSRLFFRASDGSNGTELWASDGSDGGTVMVRDINTGSGSSTPSFLTPDGSGGFYFSASDGAIGSELWHSDGTTAGTVLIKDIYSGATGSSPNNLIMLGSNLFFGADDGVNGSEIWKSDGTYSGTNLFNDTTSGTFSGGFTSPVVFAGKLFFLAWNGVGGPLDFYSTDGATVTYIKTDTANGTSYAESGGKLFFQGYPGSGYPTTGGYELWSSDGTTGGTDMLKDIFPGGTNHSYASNITAWGASGILFSATDGTSGTELWISDGTAGGTVLLKDINSGSASSGLSSFAVFDSRLFFYATDGVNGGEMWVSNGSAAGTVLFKDINAGSGSSGFGMTKVITLDNTAPTLTNTALNLTTVSAGSNTGDSIATLLATAISDPDAGAAKGMAIDFVDSSNGRWEYSLDGGVTWQVISGVTASNAFTIYGSGNERIRFLANSGFAGNASFNFRAWDGKSGHGNGAYGANTASWGGSTAFSGQRGAASITISAPPSTSSGSGTTTTTTPTGSTTALPPPNPYNSVRGDGLEQPLPPPPPPPKAPSGPVLPPPPPLPLSVVRAEGVVEGQGGGEKKADGEKLAKEADKTAAAQGKELPRELVDYLSGQGISPEVLKTLMSQLGDDMPDLSGLSPEAVAALLRQLAVERGLVAAKDQPGVLEEQDRRPVPGEGGVATLLATAVMADDGGGGISGGFDGLATGSRGGLSAQLAVAASSHGMQPEQAKEILQQVEKMVRCIN